MPGTAGGGHSGSFGGGHTGSIGGGHTGSFGGSGHVSSTSHSTSHSTGGGRVPYIHIGGGRGRSSGGGCSGVAVLLVLVPLILLGAVFTLGGNVISYFSNGNNGYRSVTSYEEVTEILEGKKPLSASQCTPIDTWMTNDVDSYLSDEETETITNALQYFYQKTGVQPYFILTDNVSGSDYPDEYEAADYLYDAYLSLFGEDEGHYLLLMVLETDGYYYTTWYLAGTDAETVMDADGSDILLSHIDANADAGQSLAEAVGGALTATADEVIDGTVVTRYEPHIETVYDSSGKNYSLMVISAIILAVLVIGGGIAAFVLLTRRNKKKQKAARETDYSAADYTEVPSAQQTGGYQPYTQKQNRTADYPVVCPNCGANAYPDERGCCQYCGTKLN